VIVWVRVRVRVLLTCCSSAHSPYIHIHATCKHHVLERGLSLYTRPCVAVPVVVLLAASVWLSDDSEYVPAELRRLISSFSSLLSMSGWRCRCIWSAELINSFASPSGVNIPLPATTNSSRLSIKWITVNQ